MALTVKKGFVRFLTEYLLTSLFRCRCLMDNNVAN